MIIRDTLPKIGNLVKGPIGPRPTKVWINSYVNIKVRHCWFSFITLIYCSQPIPYLSVGVSFAGTLPIDLPNTTWRRSEIIQRTHTRKKVRCLPLGRYIWHPLWGPGLWLWHNKQLNNRQPNMFQYLALTLVKITMKPCKCFKRK